MSEETMTAVLDRFEENADGEEVAVLLIEDDGEVVDEYVESVAALPEDGREQDAVFTVRLVDGEPVEWVYESGETDVREEAAEDRFDRLSERLSDDRDDDEE